MCLWCQRCCSSRTVSLHSRGGLVGNLICNVYCSSLFFFAEWNLGIRSILMGLCSRPPSFQEPSEPFSILCFYSRLVLLFMWFTKTQIMVFCSFEWMKFRDHNFSFGKYGLHFLLLISVTLLRYDSTTSELFSGTSVPVQLWFVCVFSPGFQVRSWSHKTGTGVGTGARGGPSWGSTPTGSRPVWTSPPSELWGESSC